jgi:histidinol-phosphate aminotransferase
VWLTTPNNPTGQIVPGEAVVKISASAPHALVFVDEAYVDFSGTTLIDDRLGRMTNVVIGRTFAKAYGLAGLRVGAVIGDARTVASMRRVVPPYSINTCATAALPVALSDTAYYDWYLDQVAQSKSMLYAALDNRGIQYWKSAANFVLARFGTNSRGIADALAARHVHVRDRSRDSGCAGCIRITAGVVDHTRAMIAALGEVL